VRTPKASYYWLQEVLAARNTAGADVGHEAADAGRQPVTADVEQPTVSAAVVPPIPAG
jgi:beta-glucosidase